MIDTTGEPRDVARRFPTGDRWHINVYELDRRYGGPEEGGWWYDTGDLQASFPVWHLEDDEIDIMLALVKKQWHDPDARDIGSVLYSGGRYEVVVEPGEGKSWPEERPHYE